eukprot:CAMPEP_0184870724 /NCGR_PEP_ID=MMETSP0580-20130426/38574_1 /TAXON_ID=1118495 /ORGANISM="Dactyliosolen fragilissimus" /LENGTH=617 /DNA_ID=CAMNT_0027372985 /DNA_START=54 /DNA_END=1907 /DNA_ORIENTATION=+
MTTQLSNLTVAQIHAQNQNIQNQVVQHLAQVSRVSQPHNIHRNNNEDEALHPHAHLQGHSSIQDGATPQSVQVPHAEQVENPQLHQLSQVPVPNVSQIHMIQAHHPGAVFHNNNGEEEMMLYDNYVPLQGNHTMVVEQQQPETLSVADARQRMNALLTAQNQADQTVEEAKERDLHAQRELTQAEGAKAAMESAVTQGAEVLTDALLQERNHWNAMYQKLVEYKEVHGHCDVKRTLLPHEKAANPDYVKLGSWVGRVRLEARRPPGHPERIEPYKIIALNRLGFDWQPRENYWMENYDKLKAYMLKHGEGKMPTRRKDPLGVWCDGQIIAYNKFKAGNPSYITQKKIDLLNELNFVWDRNSNNWNLRYLDLKTFHDKEGHCRIPKNYEDQVLYRWVGKERGKYKNFLEQKKPCQSPEQFELLKNLGFMEKVYKRGRPRKEDSESYMVKSDKKRLKKKKRKRKLLKLEIDMEDELAKEDEKGTLVEELKIPVIVGLTSSAQTKNSNNIFDQDKHMEQIDIKDNSGKKENFQQEINTSNNGMGSKQVLMLDTEAPKTPQVFADLVEDAKRNSVSQIDILSQEASISNHQHALIDNFELESDLKQGTNESVILPSGNNKE